MKDWNLPKQTFFADFGDSNSRKAGDCWRCCIAAIMGVPAESVPHFLQQEIDAKTNWKCCDELTQEWLNKQGFILARVAGYLCFDYLENSVFPVIKCGPTPRSQKMHQHHAVVFVGNEMVYDPHPSNAGLTAVIDQYLVIPLLK